MNITTRSPDVSATQEVIVEFGLGEQKPTIQSGCRVTVISRIVLKYTWSESAQAWQWDPHGTSYFCGSMVIPRASLKHEDFPQQIAAAHKPRSRVQIMTSGSLSDEQAEQVRSIVLETLRAEIVTGAFIPAHHRGLDVAP